VERVSECIKSSGGEIIIGGLKSINSKERYIAPTIIKNPSLDSKLMREEVFGPVLPILTFKNSDDLLNNYLKK
jgi:acyl-CoA reductase-like NAD-dependent aldehyde dehydrogenase